MDKPPGVKKQEMWEAGVGKSEVLRKGQAFRPGMSKVVSEPRLVS